MPCRPSRRLAAQANRPAFSAILGLVAGALGITRDAPGHEALAQGLAMAVRCDGLGAPLADFHTAQTPPQRRGRGYATRKDELAVKADLGTIVSRRDYWTDAAFTVLLWPNAEAPYPAADIAHALNRPKYAGFAGRRACPLGRPPAAKVIAATTVSEAFAAYDCALQEQEARLPARPVGAEIAFDPALADVLGELREHRREMRRDMVFNRARWQFALRAEGVAKAGGV
ncbi:CRISPR system Cascade subunit CasD [Rhodoblastus acidophilus]|uniref:type I-E CRISPR-associated protein Cas5/CasD n=1 Tax=Rhodoblastus acidophilus TaxID=1074 RepID=UPI002224F4D6|nr:type I-E CRISPR-associated protein Cas5/CasD [Rhodoblastus acidophilus]MCW2318977.1 CRISPR system Cascade subunit CasD [Rhodoblastus acidophilus]